MNAALVEERKLRQADMDRLDFAREAQHTEVQRSNRVLTWLAFGFGSVGLMAMLFAAFFQWRAINRVGEVLDQREQLRVASSYDFLPSAPRPSLNQPEVATTQRLMSALERMEQCVKELEHTAVHPLPADAVHPVAKVQTESAVA